MNKKIVLLFLCCGLFECSNMAPKYQDIGQTYRAGGYKTEKLGDLEYLIEYEGAPFTHATTLNTFTKKRADEICGINNYNITEEGSERRSQMIMSGSPFFDTPIHTKKAKVICLSDRLEFHKKKICPKRDICSIPIMYSDRGVAWTNPGLASVSINGVNITAIPFDSYINAPMCIGSNMVEIASPFDESNPDVSQTIEITTCNEHIDVTIEFSGKRKFNVYSDKPQHFTSKYRNAQKTL